MRIADIAVGTLVIASAFSWLHNSTFTTLILACLGIFQGVWYAMLRLSGRIPNARDRRAARDLWRDFLGYREK